MLFTCIIFIHSILFYVVKPTSPKYLFPGCFHGSREKRLVASPSMAIDGHADIWRTRWVVLDQRGSSLPGREGSSFPQVRMFPIGLVSVNAMIASQSRSLALQDDLTRNPPLLWESQIYLSSLGDRILDTLPVWLDNINNTSRSFRNTQLLVTTLYTLKVEYDWKSDMSP